ncbi:MAG: hypothetical protein ACI9MB_004158 [Verrucomicrobiales bacterium]
MVSMCRMSKDISKWTRLNWNPIVPGLLLLYWLRPLYQNGWNFGELTVFRWLGLITMAVWFLLACWNKISGGAFLNSLYSDDNDETPKVPDSLEEYLEGTKVSAPLVELLRENLPLGKDLETALDDYEGEDLTNEEDALGVVAAYQELCRANDPRSRLVLKLFGDSGSVEVWGLYYQLAMPLVHERFTALSERGDLVTEKDDEVPEFDREVFQLLRALCGYAYPPSFPDIVRAGRNPQLHDSYMWGRIYDSGVTSDEDYLTLIKEIGKELPTGFAGVAFLDCCNELALEHEVEPHAFSSDVGIARMREYLTDSEPEHASYAKSVATALAFIGHPGRDKLLELATNHPESDVVVEAAWADAKLGRAEGITKLVELTADWRTGETAMNFLRELELGDRIPENSLQPAHVARCQMAAWLAHPNELAKLPDEVEVIDLREIFWPPTNSRATLAIVKWSSGEDAGIGTTGGTTTWCFFGREELEDEPLDSYARHCNWQLSAEDIAGAPENYEDLDYGRKLLREKNPDEEWSARLA